MTLTAIILTYNEARHIQDCLDSVRWCDQLVVFDSFSTDDTPHLAEQAGARVIQHPFVNYTQQRNAALQAVDSEWVYFVDADERSSPTQAAEIRRKIADPTYDGYHVPRHNYILGQLTRHAGWFPDYQLRLLRRIKSRYDDRLAVHELVIVDGPVGNLETPLVHYNYTSLKQFVRKQEYYTKLAADEMYAAGIRAKPHNFLLQPLRQFYWRFITLDGYRDGWHGLRLSAMMAWYEFRKYVLLQRRAANQ